MAILRALLIQPAAIEAQVIVEAPRGGIESVIQERGVRGGQRPSAHGILVQLTEQHGENEGPRVVVRTVAL